MVSPSIFWGDKFIVHYVEALAKKTDQRIWIDTGTKEGRDAAEAQETVTYARLLETVLIKKGWRLERDLKYFEAQEAEHNERAWAVRDADGRYHLGSSRPGVTGIVGPLYHDPNEGT